MIRHLQRAGLAALVLASVAAAPPDPPPPRLDDGSRITLSQPSARAEPSDQRPIYVVIGIAVLAAAFWWNRKQRDRFDLEDGRADPARARRRRDDDSDDLHAAAEAPEPADADADHDLPRTPGSAARGPDSKPDLKN